VRYAYLFADGVHVGVRLGEDKRLCLLVIIGVREDGAKELLAVEDGYRESTDSWAEVLRDLKARGMSEPRLVTGDGALGMWGALRDVFPHAREQRCWVHKTANVLDALPKRVQPQAKRMLHEMVEAPTRQDASRAIDAFVAEFEPKWPKAAAKLTKDHEQLLAFYDFPAEHWRHLRSTNPIESSFATVKLRTRVTKGAGSKDAALAMVYKLLDAAEDRWRMINGAELVNELLDGTTLRTGSRSQTTKRRTRGSPPDASPSHPQLLTIARLHVAFPRFASHIEPTGTLARRGGADRSPMQSCAYQTTTLPTTVSTQAMSSWHPTESMMTSLKRDTRNPRSAMTCCFSD